MDIDPSPAREQGLPGLARNRVLNAVERATARTLEVIGLVPGEPVPPRRDGAGDGAGGGVRYPVRRPRRAAS